MTHDTLKNKIDTYTNKSGSSISYQYDLVGNEVFNQDSLGKTHKYEYDLQGKLLKETEADAEGKSPIVKESKYDKNGNKCFEKDPNGNIKEYSYNKLNNIRYSKAQVTDIDGNKKTEITNLEYNNFGSVIKETNWLGNSIQYKYDGLGRLVEKIDGVGNVIEKLQYYNNGVQSKSIDALGNEKIYEYDNKNRKLISTTYGEGNKVSQGYDEIGNLAYKVDGKGNRTSYNYDGLNRLISVTNAKGEVTSYTYDNNGNKKEQIDGKGNKTTWEYNVANKVSKIISPGGKLTEEFTYFADGSLKTKKDRNGQTIQYNYDIHG